jgi:GNAT superfamily N-acetyltransferase
MGPVPSQTDEMSGGPADAASATYEKVPFEWEGSKPPPDERVDESVCWLAACDDERFPGIVAQVLAASPDESDQARVERLGAAGAARDLLEAVPQWGLSYRPEWWEMVAVGEEPVGFVLPVIYDNTSRDGLDEATIFHVGLVPGQRGQGLGRTLLRRATRTLLTHGVWRIYCDTAANNAPMIHLFETEGWARQPAHQQPV